MLDPDAALKFLDFVVERHQIWESRQVGAPQPWTDDPVLATRKFTNVFRLLDPGSQFVIKDLLEPGLPDEEFLMRCFLYRHTNLPSAWRAWLDDTGQMPLIEDLYEFEVFLLDHAASGQSVFSGAYMIYPQSSTPGTNKIQSILDLTRRVVPELIDDFYRAGDQQSRFAALRKHKGVADFMSMQILTDFGYGTGFRENEFVVPGPGARKGAAALGLSGEEAIEWGYSSISQMDQMPMIWGSGNRGHFLSKMDVQNCLCEFSKYVRFSNKPSPQKTYAPAHPGVQLKPLLPPHWYTNI